MHLHLPSRPTSYTERVIGAGAKPHGVHLQARDAQQQPSVGGEIESRSRRYTSKYVRESPTGSSLVPSTRRQRFRFFFPSVYSVVCCPTASMANQVYCSVLVAPSQSFVLRHMAGDVSTRCCLAPSLLSRKGARIRTSCLCSSVLCGDGDDDATR